MIKQIFDNKKQYIDLLLLADECEDMIDKYLERGDMYVLYSEKKVCSSIIVTDEGGGVLEIKNIAVYPEFQRKGYGIKLIRFIEKSYKDRFSTVIVGTGDSPLTLPFYEKCGFTRFRTVKNFFTDNYKHPIFEDSVRLCEMIYKKKNL